MAEGAQTPPTFKLVLVGDGGTGKASGIQLVFLFGYAFHTPEFLMLGPGSSQLTRLFIHNIPVGRQLTKRLQTTFVKRHLTGEFEKKYIATLGVEVHPLTFTTVCPKPHLSIPSSCSFRADPRRTWVQSSLTCGIPLARRSSVVCGMDTTSTASVVSSCSM